MRRQRAKTLLLAAALLAACGTASVPGTTALADGASGQGTFGAEAAMTADGVSMSMAGGPANGSGTSVTGSAPNGSGTSVAGDAAIGSSMSVAGEAANGAAGTTLPPMLDPGFGYYSHFMHDLALSLLANSPVTAYLPTRLPSSGWQYYGLKSELSGTGYSVTAFRAAEAQKPTDTLPKAGSEAAVDPASVLYRLKAGRAAETKLAMPETAKQLLAADDWAYWADGPAGAGSAAAALTAKFAAMAKPGAPIAGATGTVLIAGTGGNTVYSASWTIDGSTYYSFVGHGSLADFTSMLTSFRPVANLLESADVVLLPKDLQLNLQVGRGQLFEPYENAFVALSKAPALYGGSVYLPLRDIATVIGGQIQYVGQEGAVYVSQNGYYNELKLNLRTGAVTRGQEKLGTVKLVMEDGTTLVPLRFMTEQFGLPADYDAASKDVTVHASKWAIQYNRLQTDGKPDLPVKVFTVGGPPFTYANSKLEGDTAFGYENTKPPQGYNGLKYVTYRISIPLLPADNELVLRDMQTGRVLTGIPVEGTVSPDAIPFRASGLGFFDGVAMKVKLASSNGKAWAGGYAETFDAVDITSEADFAALKFDSLKVGYRIGTTKSGIVSVPVKDGKFAYRLKPNKGPGTYVVTLYAPRDYPLADLPPIVSFIVVVPPPSV